MSKKSRRATVNAPINAPYQRRNQRSEDFEIETCAVYVVYEESHALGTGKKRIPSE